jgi:hypothetical protein
MVERDRAKVATRFGPIEIGGEAQLEALAYLAQSRFVSGFYGMKGARAFRDALYDLDSFSDKYFSVIEIAAQFGLLPYRQRSRITQGTVVLGGPKKGGRTMML